MNTHHHLNSLENYDEFEDLYPVRNQARGQRLDNRKDHRAKLALTPAQAANLGGGTDEFKFSYHASRHERQWLIDSLGGFYDQQWFDDVLRLLKGGKEASVYQCLGNATTGTAYIAAKVYRPRLFRNLKNDHVYQQGRPRLDQDGRLITNNGMNHAMDKRTEYGQQLLHASWIEHEYQTLTLLYAAGADAPVPYERGNNAILMEYIGDDDMPAPTLNSVDLEPGEAHLLFERVLHNVEILLAHDRVHGDLSAYNILYWEGAIKLIDFPQAINPGTNSSAWRIFERDILRVSEYFVRQGLAVRPHLLAADLWTAYGHRLAPEVDPRLLDDQDEADLALWRRQAEQQG